MNKNKNDTGQGSGKSPTFSSRVSETQKLLSKRPVASESNKTNKRTKSLDGQKRQDKWASWIKQVKLSFESLELVLKRESDALLKHDALLAPVSTSAQTPLDLVHARKLVTVADMIQQSGIRGLLNNPSALYLEAARIVERHLSKDTACFNEAAHAYLELGSNCWFVRSDIRTREYLERAIQLYEKAPQVDEVQLVTAYCQFVLSAPSIFFTSIAELEPAQSALNKAWSLWTALPADQAKNVNLVLRDAIINLHNRYQQAIDNFGDQKKDGELVRSCLKLLFQMHPRQAEIKTLTKTLVKLKAIRFANDTQRQTYIESLELALAYQSSLPQSTQLAEGSLYLACRVPPFVHQGSISRALRTAIVLAGMKETGDNTSPPKIDSVILRRGQVDIKYKGQSKSALSGRPMRMAGADSALPGPLAESTRSGKSAQIAKPPQTGTNRKARNKARRDRNRASK